MGELKNLIRLEKDIEAQESMIEKLTSEKLEELKVLQNEIQALRQPYEDCIRDDKEEITNIRQNILDTWNEDWGKQFTDDETKIMLTRKVRTSPEVHNEKALLTQAVTFDEMPIKKIGWDNSKLKALISAGVIKKDIAYLSESFELAVTYPKE